MNSKSPIRVKKLGYNLFNCKVDGANLDQNMTEDQARWTLYGFFLGLGYDSKTCQDRTYRHMSDAIRMR